VKVSVASSRSAPEGGGAATEAVQTDRGYFLFNQTEVAPDPALNCRLEHVGFSRSTSTIEITMADLASKGVIFWDEERGQCAGAAAGSDSCPDGAIDWWFYVMAPNGARIEISRSPPGPSSEGFGHQHIIEADIPWWTDVLMPDYTEGTNTIAVGGVNITDAALLQDVFEGVPQVESKGKPIDHLAYSTTDLEAEKARIEALGITIEEDISFKARFGFKSFFFKSPENVWIEFVEDSPFQQQ